MEHLRRPVGPTFIALGNPSRPTKAVERHREHTRRAVTVPWRAPAQTRHRAGPDVHPSCPVPGASRDYAEEESLWPALAPAA
jgi:hypothetical protein